MWKNGWQRYLPEAICSKYVNSFYTNEEYDSTYVDCKGKARLTVERMSLARLKMVDSVQLWMNAHWQNSP